jgi:hypothetical protein
MTKWMREQKILLAGRSWICIDDGCVIARVDRFFRSPKRNVRGLQPSIAEYRPRPGLGSYPTLHEAKAEAERAVRGRP